MRIFFKEKKKGITPSLPYNGIAFPVLQVKKSTFNLRPNFTQFAWECEQVIKQKQGNFYFFEKTLMNLRISGIFQVMLGLRILKCKNLL